MDITLKNLQRKVPIPRARILKAAKKALRKLDLGQRDLSIVFAGTRRMRSINRRYLKHDFATDVLTFDLGQGIGEIIVCPQVACRQARRHQTSTEQEIILYVIHGLLHLAGFDDRQPQDVLVMRRMERELIG